VSKERAYKIAVVAGDGIGREVIPEGMQVVEAAGRKFGFSVGWKEFDWSCERFAKTGRMMPEDGIEAVKPHDAIYLGAVGYPGVPDHISLWGLLIPLRRELDLYANIRPVRLLDGITSPLAGRTKQDIDFIVVRENSEGEYSSIGGRAMAGTENELVIQESVFTRRGTDRILDYAFKLAQTRQRKHVTSATKSNGISISMPYWDERFALMKKNNPDIKTDQYHIDIQC
jgi:tartrate dehydrogenase/decarboxylase/D-malate dehydrogenase